MRQVIRNSMVGSVPRSLSYTALVIGIVLLVYSVLVLQNYVYLLAYLVVVLLLYVGWWVVVTFSGNEGE